MDKDSSVAFGKKIFFLNPTYSLKKDIIPALREEEFEIYTADNILYLKNILRSYKDSLLFVTPDNQFSSKAYYNYIHSFYGDPELKDIKIGILAKQQKDEEKELYLSKGRLDLGYSLLNEKDTQKQVASLKSIFEMNDAKGRRQFVRASCLEDKEAKVFWTTKDKMHLFNILDISTAAVAVKAPLYVGPSLTKDEVLHGLTLLLDGRQYVFDATVFAIKPKDDCIMVVLVMKKNMLPETINGIRKYISIHLQKAADDLGASKPKDTFAYTTLTFYDEATGKAVKQDKDSKQKDSGESSQTEKTDEKNAEEKPAGSEEREGQDNK